MLKIIRLLAQAKLLSPKGIFSFVSSFYTIGVNIGVIAKVAARLYPDSIAIVYERERITYRQLYERAIRLANGLKQNHQLSPKQKIAIACANHPAHIYALFAAGLLGLDIYLLNAETGESQFRKLVEKHNFDFIIYDTNLETHIINNGYKNRSLVAIADSEASAHNYAGKEIGTKWKWKRSNFGKIVVLTAGTTGVAKTAERKASAFTFLSPFSTLLDRLNLVHYRSLYLATPVYHGFGIIALIISLVLGKEVYICQKFETKKACRLIQKHKIEVITIVPIMLQRMLDEDAPALNSLQCIISGGAALAPSLVVKTQNTLGDKLFNLYGTSEAGFCIMSTPAHLRHAPDTIGRPLPNVGIKVVDSNELDVEAGTVGQIVIKCEWSVSGKEWVKTGDIGYADKDGYYFLMGRTDDMIVSGGENVYPCELENILMQHPSVREVAVIGVSDSGFGQRLKAYIVPHGMVDDSEIRGWLSNKAARYQMPRDIEFIQQLPITSVGKVDKKLLIEASKAVRFD